MPKVFLILLFLAPLAWPASAAEIFANRTLRVGSVIGATDLSGNGEGAKALIAELVGLEARRAIYTGHRVRAADLGPPTLVRRNEIVAMTYRAGALGLRTEGRAMGDGGSGELIEVMNLTSRQVVRATVVGRRSVTVRR